MVLGVIPARGGSKGVKNKNIKNINGKPLINYTIEEAQKSKIDDLIVSTDSELISNLAISKGVIVPFVRPSALASDSARSIDVINHALIEMERLNSKVYDYVIMLQPTTPFRKYTDIDNCIGLIKNNRQADSVISVVDVQGNHPARMKYIKDGKLIDPIFCEETENQNRQELTPMYIRNGAIYLSSRETILKKSFKGNICLAYEMDKFSSINIDTIEDFQYAKFLSKK
tara:strand:- start:404 stop:1087 length:684 start_codon:yes stop_codon:yes gene_type:complete